jgi:CHASE3 domain sensor protein
MSQPTPSFPAFDEWQKMSESEQDALLDRLERASQPGSTIRTVLVGMLCVAACAVVGAMFLAMRP